MHTIENMDQMVQAANFGDLRLNKRMGILLGEFFNQADSSIPQVFKNRSQMKAAYNFLDNDKVTPDKILQAQLAGQFSEQLKEHHTVLALHDTTELDFTGKRSQDEIGCLKYQYQKGFYLHNTLMVSTSGIPLSVFAQHYWSRQESELRKKKERKLMGIENKESYRWVKGFENVQNYFRQHPDVTVINVCDREADIHELLQIKQTPQCHYIIRSCNNRRVADHEQKLWQQVNQSPEQGQYSLLITDQATQQSRTAVISVRYRQSITIEPSYRKDKQALQPIEVNIVEAREENAPAGVKAVDWKLLTTLKVETFEDAHTVLNYYSYRWRIESFHYVLKIGCRVEKLQLEQAHNLQNAITLYSLIACQILRWMHLSRQQPITDIKPSGYGQQEAMLLHGYLQHAHQIKVEIKNSHQPTLQEFVKMIGILGGFKDWKKQPHPGAKALWCGLREFEIICSSFQFFQSHTYG